MAKKPTLTTVTSGFTSGAVINDNFTDLSDAFDNTLSRDGSTPNEMLADLDMNSNDILNAGSLDVGTLRINGVSVLPTDVVGYETDFKYDFKSVENLLNDTKDYTYFAAGDYTRAGTGLYEVAASGATDHHVVSGGGVKHYVRTPVMNLREFGVFGNDTVGSLVDETAQFTKAMDAAIATESKLIIPGTNYLISSYSSEVAGQRVWVEGEHSNPPVLYATQAKADAGGLLINLDCAPAIAFGTVTVTADVLAGDQRITVSSTAGMAEGMLLQISSNVEWYYDGRENWYKGELFRIGRVISGTVVELDHPAHLAYDVSGEAVGVEVSLSSRFIIENLEFRSPTPVGAGISMSGLRVDRSWRSELNNLAARNFTFQALSLRRSMFSEVNNYHAEVVGRDGSVGYGLSPVGNYGCTFRNINGRSLRRLVDFNGISGSGQGCISINNTLDGFVTRGAGVDAEGSEYRPFGTDPSFGVGMHGPALGTKILNGFIEGPNSGITVRGGNTTIRNVTFMGKMENCIKCTYGSGVDIQGCNVVNEMLGDGGSAAGLTINRDNQPLQFLELDPDGGLGFWNYGAPTVVQNNNCQGLHEAFISFRRSGVTAHHLIVTDNYVQAFPDNVGGTDFMFFAAPNGAVNIVESTLMNNTMHRISGNGGFRMYGTNITLGDNTTYGVDAAVQVSSNQYIMTIADDTVARVKLDKVTGIESMLVNIDADSVDYRGLVRLRQNSATKVDIGTVGANVEALSTSPSGTSGVNGNLSLHLGRLEDLSLTLENRLGSKKTFLVTLL